MSAAENEKIHFKTEPALPCRALQANEKNRQRRAKVREYAQQKRGVHLEAPCLKIGPRFKTFSLFGVEF